jgi:glucosylceramidase
VESWGRIKEWLNAGVNSYLAWNMVLDTNGVNLDTSRRWAQNALLAVDRNAKKLNITPYYYVFRHLAQFVEPGSQRVSTQGGDALAWKNTDGSVVVVMYNSGGSPAQTTVDIGGTLLQLEIPSRGWATVNWAG